jgi:glutaredoxin 3
MQTPRFRPGLAAWVACLALAAAPAAAEAPAGPFVYTDASGSTHMVQTLDQVPAKRRASARSLGAGSKSDKKVEYQSRVTTVSKQRAARARERAKALEAIPERRRETVLFYTASWCGVCKYMRAHLEKRGIAYDERSIDEPEIKRELADKIGTVYVPVVEYEGERIIGYRPEAIDALGL